MPCPQHPVEGRPHQIASLDEELFDRGAVVLEVSRIGANREAHRRGLCRDAELRKQRREAGIVRLVVDNETGVDVAQGAEPGKRHRVHVPANPVVGLEQGHLMAWVQPMRYHEPRDSAAHHGDLHAMHPPRESGVARVADRE